MTARTRTEGELSKKPLRLSAPPTGEEGKAATIEKKSG